MRLGLRPATAERCARAVESHVVLCVTIADQSVRPIRLTLHVTAGLFIGAQHAVAR